MPGGLLVEHVQADDGLAAVDRGAQGRVVGEAQVVAEPDDRRLAHSRIVTAPTVHRLGSGRG